MPQSLADNEVHLWLTYDDEITDSALLQQYKKLLTDDETARMNRFVFEKHQKQFLIARALVRTTLSRYLDYPPTAWRFSQNQYGRPEPVLSQSDPPLRFNLSHTDGLIAIGVTLQRDLGVDVEKSSRNSDLLLIAQNVFSAAEQQALHDQPTEDAQRQRFFDYWTLKESYIKARGMGLSLPLEKFSFQLEHRPAVTVQIDPQLNDDSSSLVFGLFTPDKTHRAAVCARKLGSELIALRLWRTIPLGAETPLSVNTQKIEGGFSLS